MRNGEAVELDYHQRHRKTMLRSEEKSELTCDGRGKDVRVETGSVCKTFSATTKVRAMPNTENTDRITTVADTHQTRNHIPTESTDLH